MDGEVDLHDDPWSAAGNIVRLKVAETFHGLPSATATVEADVAGDFRVWFAIPFVNGQCYLVSLERPLPPSGRFTFHSQDSAKDVREVERDLRLIRERHLGTMPGLGTC
ncbi:MAG: hypothetical protein FJW40_01535 [Acidobacteria bacterium]|nr:hypothetical protein [Acidobacteriota bacterium]